MQKIVQKLALVLVCVLSVGLAHAQSDDKAEMQALYANALSHAMGQVPVYAQPVDDKTPLDSPKNLYYLMPGNVGVVDQGCANLRSQIDKFEALDDQEQPYLLLVKQSGECIALVDDLNPNEEMKKQWVDGVAADVFGEKWRIRFGLPTENNTLFNGDSKNAEPQ